MLVEVEPEKVILVLGSSLPNMDFDNIVHEGRIVLRAALALLYSSDALIVQRVVDDFGRDYRGESAFEFMIRKGDSFPRASVLGRRTVGVEVEQMVLKELDLARGVQVFAYGEDQNELLAYVGATLAIKGQHVPDNVPSIILSGLSIQVVTGEELSTLIGRRKD
jgi:hypothetical protein